MAGEKKGKTEDKPKVTPEAKLNVKEAKALEKTGEDQAFPKFKTDGSPYKQK